MKIGLLLLLTALPAHAQFLDTLEDFMKSGPRPVILPEDEDLGPLADPEDPRWREALSVCNEFLDALARGELPLELLDPMTLGPQALALEEALASKPTIRKHRYGHPQRKGTRLTLPLRLWGAGEQSILGHIHLHLDEEKKTWFVEQVAIALTTLAPKVVNAP